MLFLVFPSLLANLGPVSERAVHRAGIVLPHLSAILTAMARVAQTADHRRNFVQCAVSLLCHSRRLLVVVHMLRILAAGAGS